MQQPLNNLQTLAIILCVAAGTVLTRFVPFWLFPENRRVPRVVLDLGRMLPAAMMGLLLVYCLKGVNFAAQPHGIPEAVALAGIYALHRWKHNTLLSIGAGTAVYLVLIRVMGG